MAEGDACITTFHMPHSGTRNALGTESRKNVIFRIRAKSHNPCVARAASQLRLDAMVLTPPLCSQARRCDGCLRSP
jgi:hypothetical protein